MRAAILLACLCCLCAVALGGLHNPPHPMDRFLYESFAVVIDPKVTLTLNSTVQTTSSQNFKLTITGGPGKATDVVALYAPANADPATVLFVKYILGSQIPGYIGTGAGTYTFTLLNLRADSKFSLITGGLGSNLQAPNFTIVAQSPVITNKNVNEPTQGHLAATRDPGTMLISWTTKNSAAPTSVPRAPGSLPHWLCMYLFCAGTTKTYTKADLCAAPATGTGFFDPGSLHTAAMTGLQPSTKYYYIYGSDADGYSQEAFFVSAPALGDTSLVKAQADGSNEPGRDEKPSIAVTNGIASEIANGYTLNIHNGDLSYADGFLADWDNYYEQISVYTRYLPFMTVPGNHERDGVLTGDAFMNPGSNDARGECGVVYARRQSMPQQPGQDKSVMNSAPLALGVRSYYSFDYGPIHFLQYDSETPYQPGSLQRLWIESDLAAVDRSKTPWLVVGVHRMFYADSSDYRSNDDADQTVAARMRSSLEDLFRDAKVDAMFFGHQHAYARTCPTYKNACQASKGEESTGTLNSLNANSSTLYYEPSAPIYYLIGNAGRLLSTADFLEDPQPAIFANINLKYGYLRLRANATALITEAVEAPSGIVFDTVTIVKNNETSLAAPTKHELVAGALTNLTRDVISQPLQLPHALSDLSSAIKG
ncbi:Metallo-dependent phosphatase [Coccomyxa subellipsoidea C-169]|uniref:Purple acid phosphatase n=1 Tax=Coccomyxa subellipsoidea (strain C-169) TaxID=574566 RepID=I0Z0Q6_COCSC|nr:Metallo-dependent phosphatase [Coccomyxa subellipsoidea C-169]EIE24225.1 Metallo-dependent phosphatase [Coccomyxa subellipsoidea C-169]|eukprot:XP_005648769.1 Metallo-dependent phosphatase [Coccomyxa subellipsoidea C-169]